MRRWLDKTPVLIHTPNYSRTYIRTLITRDNSTAEPVLEQQLDNYGIVEELPVRKEHKHSLREYVRWFFLGPDKKRYLRRATNIVRCLNTMAESEEPFRLSDQELQILMRCITRRHIKRYRAIRDFLYEHTLFDLCLNTNKRLGRNFYYFSIDTLNIYLQKLATFSNYELAYKFIYDDLIEDRKFRQSLLPNLQSFAHLMNCGNELDVFDQVFVILTDPTHIIHDHLSNDLPGFHIFVNNLIHVLLRKHSMLNEAITIFNVIRRSDESDVVNVYDMARPRQSEPHSIFYRKEKIKCPHTDISFDVTSKLQTILEKLIDRHGENFVSLYIYPSSKTIHELLCHLARAGRMQEAIFMYGFPYAEFKWLKKLDRSVARLLESGKMNQYQVRNWTAWQKSPHNLHALVQDTKIFLGRVNYLTQHYFLQGLHHMGNELYFMLYNGDFEHYHNLNAIVTKIKKILPNENTFAIMLEAFATLGDEKRIATLVEEQKTFKVVPKRIIFMGLIRGFTVRGNMTHAIRMLDLMQEQKVPVSTRIINNLITGFVNVGKIDESMKFLVNDQFWMSNGCRPAMDTYVIVMKAYSKQRVDVLKVVGVMFLMYVRHFAGVRKRYYTGVIPNRSTYQIVFETMAKANLDQEQSELTQEMIIKLAQEPPFPDYEIQPKEKLVRDTTGKLLIQAWHRVEQMKAAKMYTTEDMTTACMNEFYPHVFNLYQQVNLWRIH
jgi:pentatricopeptide repeat protein